MSKLRPLSLNGGVLRSFGWEDGVQYRHYKQDFDPVIKHREHMNHKVNDAPTSGNASQWRHVGSIPMALLIDWLTKHGYTMDQWARNDGGEPSISVDNYHKDGGVKSKFLRYFFSRDFSKLHNRHITTKRESLVHQVPQGFKKQGSLIVPT